MNRILQAADFAAKKHRRQKSDKAEGSPYINHPIEVAFHLSTVGGVEDENILIAALLHDTIEDTQTTRDEIVAVFGEAVAALVIECSDDMSLHKPERKRLQVVSAPKKSYGAKMIKIADKTCNLRAILSASPEDWPHERQYDYFVWAEKVVAGLLGQGTKQGARLCREASIERRLEQTEQKRPLNCSCEFRVS